MVKFFIITLIICSATISFAQNCVEPNLRLDFKDAISSLTVDKKDFVEETLEIVCDEVKMLKEKIQLLEKAASEKSTENNIEGELKALKKTVNSIKEEIGEKPNITKEFCESYLTRNQEVAFGSVSAAGLLFTIFKLLKYALDFVLRRIENSRARQPAAPRNEEEG